MGGSRVWLVAGVAALCLSSGCSDDGGGGGAGGASAGGAGGGASTESWANGECGACVQTECADQIAACLSDPGCASYWSCLSDCPTTGINGDADSDCDDACSGGASSEAIQLRAKLKGCRFYGDGAEGCTECGRTFSTTLPPSNQSCGAFEPPIENPDVCETCVFEQCCETWTAREADAGSGAIMDCVQSCADSACYEGCFTANQASASTWTAQFACRWVHCAGDADCDASTRNGCDACAYQTCADSFEDVLADPEAFVLWTCTAIDCESQDFSTECIEDCFDAYPAGEEKNLLWAECLAAQCSTCEGG